MRRVPYLVFALVCALLVAPQPLAARSAIQRVRDTPAAQQPDAASAAAAVPDVISRSGFEDGEFAPCQAIPDADYDGLLDLGCAVAFAPPDPGTILPPADHGAPGDFFDDYKPLFEGASPVQRGVGPGAIDPQRAAIVRGVVRDANGAPLPGVLVREPFGVDHGYTFTRSDGAFDFVVNGGGTVTLDFQRSGFLRAQRTIAAVPWQDFVVVEDLVLVALDSRISAIDMRPGSGPQIARANPVSDADGTRQATLFFPADTQATMTVRRVGGSFDFIALSTAHVRATEYTVGTRGPQRMPADLPSTSAYTYAVELSVDEATAGRAERVAFTRPVSIYLENFIGLPVGTAIPQGTYDFLFNVWVPENNGRVVKVLAVNSGRAVLDVTGAGSPASQSELDALGITTDELDHIGATYAAGQELWRATVTHFTPCDLNMSELAPDDAVSPDITDPSKDTPKDENKKDPCEKGGSIIECENQTVGESIPIAGTPFTLNYHSRRAPGRVLESTASIAIRQTALPPSVKRISLDVSIAGKSIHQDLPADPSQGLSYAWDGKDAYGRAIRGARKATIKVGYVYDANYTAPPPGSSGFALYSQTETRLSADPSRKELTIYKTVATNLGDTDPDPDTLGGWSLSGHHEFNPTVGIVGLGAGKRVDVKNYDQVARVAAGKRFDFSQPFYPEDLLVQPNGRLLIATYGGPIYELQPNGSRIVVAGGSATACGSVPCYPSLVAATDVQFDDVLSMTQDPSGCYYVLTEIPNIIYDAEVIAICGNFAYSVWDHRRRSGGVRATGVAYGADGWLYVSSTQGIERVDPYGSDPLSEVFVTLPPTEPVPPTAGDEGPASLAYVRAHGIAAAPTGALFILDIDNSVRRIDPDGTIHRVAGRPQPECALLATACSGNSGDGGAALDAKISVQIPPTHNAGRKIDVARDGSIVFVDQSNVVRRIAPDGRISTLLGVAGQFSDDCNSFGAEFPGCGNGSRANSYQVSNISAIATSPEFKLYIASPTYENVVHEVAAFLPVLRATTTTIAAPRGNAAFRFDRAGRHTATYSRLTGAQSRGFEYDASGRLTALIDAYGNRTTIERDPAGKPTAIVAQDGERTVLTLDVDGYLASVVDPENQSYAMTYFPGGLLKSFRNPRGYTSTFTYDAEGRLLSDSNAALGGYAASVAPAGGGREVTLTSAEGRGERFRYDQTADGGRVTTLTARDGAVTLATEHSNGVMSLELPDGVVETMTAIPDPGFGMQTPSHDHTIALPSSLTWSSKSRRQVTLADENDPLSLTGMTTSTTVNGRVYSAAYQSSTQTYTLTSPAGRTRQITIDVQGRPVQISVPGLASVDYTYDARGRLIQIGAGAGAERRTITFGYDANGYLDTVVDPLGHAILLDNDAVGRTKTQTLPDARQLSFGYDAGGHVTSLTPPGRPAHTAELTPADQPNTSTPPAVPGIATPATTYRFNRDQQLEQVTRPDGLVITPVYNAATGRLSQIQTPAGTYNYTFLPGGQPSAVVAPGGESLSFVWDGPLPKSVAWSGTVAGTVGYTFDNNFWLKQVDVAGTSVTYGYDADGLLTSAQHGTDVLTLSRNAQNGLLAGTVLGSVSDSWTYNTFGEPAQYEARYGASAFLKTLFERDKLGRITKKTETVGGQTIVFEYGYDDAGRLKTVTQGGVLVAEYSYDSNSNRVGAALAGSGVAGSGCAAGETSVAGTLDAQDRLLTYGHCTFTYSANGELKTRTDSSAGTAMSYSYDVMGNLRHVTLANGDAVDYAIDAQNRRIGKRVNGVLTQGFLYFNQLKPVAELDGAGNVVSVFIYAEHGNSPSYMLRAGHVYRVLVDQLGSPRLVVDVADGSIAQRIDYDAWGRVLIDTNPGFQPFGFAGGIADRDTGLVRFGVRDYDPDVGRWTIKDPIRFRSGLALVYSYCGQDPINAVDSDGRLINVVAALVGGAIGAVAGGVSAYFRHDDIWIGIGIGAATGLTAGLTLGGSLAVELLAGAGISIGGEALEELLNYLKTHENLRCFEFDLADLAAAAAFGTAGAGVSRFFSKYAEDIARFNRSLLDQLFVPNKADIAFLSGIADDAGNTLLYDMPRGVIQDQGKGQ